MTRTVPVRLCPWSLLVCLLFPLCLVPCLTGCHYVELAGGQLALMNRQRPLAEAASDEPDAERRRLLERVPDVLSFARTYVQLDPGTSYTGFYDTEAHGLTFVLSASEKTRFEPYTWWFPIAGEVPYKSYFAEGTARDEQAELERAGYDTYLGQSTAYSTLGLLRDPVLSTMTDRGLIGFVEVLLHELTHAKLYVQGQTDWNEQLASFVARKATPQYFRSRSGGDPVVMGAVADHFARREKLERAMEAAIDELEQLYDSGRREVELLRERERVFARVQGELKALYPEAEPDDLLINNARLLQYARYSGSVEYLEAIWQDAGENWMRFWPLIEHHARRDL